jgi:hypothetical protein
VSLATERSKRVGRGGVRWLRRRLGVRCMGLAPKRGERVSNRRRRVRRSRKCLPTKLREWINLGHWITCIPLAFAASTLAEGIEPVLPVFGSRILTMPAGGGVGVPVI